MDAAPPPVPPRDYEGADAAPPPVPPRRSPSFSSPEAASLPADPGGFPNGAMETSPTRPPSSELHL